MILAEKIQVARVVVLLVVAIVVLLLAAVFVLLDRLRTLRREAAWTRRLLRAHERIDYRVRYTIDAIERLTR